MNVKVFQELQSITAAERRQQATSQVDDDIPPAAIDLFATKQAKSPVLNDYFFSKRHLIIRKHNRFAPYPLHSHLFFEINYMLRGCATEYINGKRVKLSEGDVLLLDIGTKHSIATLDNNDLMINVLFDDELLSVDFLDQINASETALQDFLANPQSKRTGKPRYYLFTNSQTQASGAITTLSQLIDEYYMQPQFCDYVMQAELAILLAQLMRTYKRPKAAQTSGQILADKIMEDIKNNYRKLSLDDLAEKYSYNRTYLSNLFRKEAGRPFSEVLTEERLRNARRLIQTTDIPIGEICHDVGISNKSFFYHKYAEKFGHIPREDRIANRPPIVKS
ncbi:AraC family transcriptional regulator [Lacticaseibacillus sp. GG6-2]